MERLGRVLGSLLAVALTVFSLQSLAAAQMGGRDFNHMATGFILSGGHAVAACETCHIGGVFKGTPKTCDGCHATGKRIIATPKSSSHIVTDAPCETCHFNTSTWLGAKFNHGSARKNDCAACHNSRIAAGKHASHKLTSASCDSCHRVSAWIPAGWDHTGVTGDCSSCHKPGGTGTYFSKSHMSQAVMTGMGITNCNVCHKNYSSFYGAYYDHAGASLDCNTCHGNPAFSGVKQKTTAIHNVTTSLAMNCQSCHKSFSSFSGGKYDHVGAGVCSSCHDGVHSINGQIKGMNAISNHFPTTVACSSCHRTSSWIPAAYYDHSGVSLDCNSCHGSGIYQGVKVKASSIHNVTSSLGMACNSCHKTFTSFSGGKYDHVGAGVCSFCHDGAHTDGGQIKGMNAISNHFPTTDTCNSCHRTTAWTPATYLHTGTGACLSCHTGSYAGASGKRHLTNTTAKATWACNDCHSSTTSWLPAAYKHATAAACSSCHNGGVAVGKSSGHFSTTLECNQCHLTTTTWSGALGGMPANHIPFSASSTCSTCHTGSIVSTGLSLHNAIGTGYTCYSCHGKSAAYLGTMEKASWPNYHESSKNPAAADCSASGCHRPVGSKGSTYIKWD